MWSSSSFTKKGHAVQHIYKELSKNTGIYIAMGEEYENQL